MLMMYCEQCGYRGYLTGMRSDESKGRLANRKFRGLSYLKKDGISVCNPLGDWSAADVWAAVVSNDLPCCHHYQLIYERFGTSPESPTSRVDMVVAPETATVLPLMYITKVLYPDLYERICQARPECRKDES
jgi:predicted phosphoadenosine phosphosulfate sulfurtransferase